MSAYSTLHISRNAALLKYFKQILGEPTDAQVEKFLDTCYRESLYKFIITGQESEPDDDRLEFL